MPVYEEIATRLFLKFSKRNIIISLAFNLGLIYFFFIGGSHIIAYIISCAVILIVVMLLMTEGSFFSKNLKNWWESRYSYIFYGSVVLFSFYHALEYQFESIIIGLLIFILVLPKAVSGCLLGYARVRLGFGWGVTLYIAINTIFYLFIFSAALV